jgi:hypothetical protein
MVKLIGVTPGIASSGAMRAGTARPRIGRLTASIVADIVVRTNTLELINIALERVRVMGEI